MHSLIRRDILEVESPFFGTRSYKTELASGNAFKVVYEGQFFGLVSHKDCRFTSTEIFADCLKDKAKLYPGFAMANAHKYMKEVDTDSLPYYEGDDLVGFVTKDGILEWLFAERERNFQEPLVLNKEVVDSMNTLSPHPTHQTAVTDRLTKKVFLLDDDMEFIDRLALLLVNTEYKLFTTNNPMQAIVSLLAIEGGADLIMCSSKVDASSFIYILRNSDIMALYKHTPIIALSHQTNPHIFKKSVEEVGASYWINKSLPDEEIFSLIEIAS